MANTPNLDLVKPAGTDHALVSVINSNNDKIDAGFGTLSEQIAMNSFGTKATIAALESDLATFGSSMPNNSVRNIVFALDPAQGVFKNANYVGTISRTSSGRYTVLAQSHSSVQRGDLVVGIYANSAWSWGNIAIETLASGQTATNQMSVIKRSGICEFRFSMTVSTAYADGATIDTIPAGFRPAQTVDFPVFATSGVYLGMCRILTSGVLSPVFGQLNTGTIRLNVVYTCA